MSNPESESGMRPELFAESQGGNSGQLYEQELQVANQTCQHYREKKEGHDFMSSVEYSIKEWAGKLDRSVQEVAQEHARNFARWGSPDLCIAALEITGLPIQEKKVIFGEAFSNSAIEKEETAKRLQELPDSSSQTVEAYRQIARVHKGKAEVLLKQ